MTANARPCGACRHLDGRTDPRRGNFCWQFYRWQQVDEVVADCNHAERADGGEPPGVIRFSGERR